MLILHEQQSKASMEIKTYVHKNAVEKTWAIRNTTRKMLSKGKESKVLNSYVCCSLCEAALFNRILVEIGMVLDDKMKIELDDQVIRKFTPFRNELETCFERNGQDMFHTYQAHLEDLSKTHRPFDLEFSENMS